MCSVLSGEIFWGIWCVCVCVYCICCTSPLYWFLLWLLFERMDFVLLFAVEMDRSVCWSFVPPSSAFTASVTPIINYSPLHGAGLAGCRGNGARLHRGYTPLLWPRSLSAVLFDCLRVIDSLTGLNIRFDISPTRCGILKVTRRCFRWTLWSLRGRFVRL